MLLSKHSDLTRSQARKIVKESRETLHELDVEWSSALAFACEQIYQQKYQRTPDIQEWKSDPCERPVRPHVFRPVPGSEVTLQEEIPRETASPTTVITPPSTPSPLPEKLVMKPKQSSSRKVVQEPKQQEQATKPSLPTGPPLENSESRSQSPTSRARSPQRRAQSPPRRRPSSPFRRRRASEPTECSTSPFRVISPRDQKKEKTRSTSPFRALSPRKTSRAAPEQSPVQEKSRPSSPFRFRSPRSVQKPVVAPESASPNSERSLGKALRRLSPMRSPRTDSPKKVSQKLVMQPLWNSNSQRSARTTVSLDQHLQSSPRKTRASTKSLNGSRHERRRDQREHDQQAPSATPLEGYLQSLTAQYRKVDVVPDAASSRLPPNFPDSFREDDACRGSFLGDRQPKPPRRSTSDDELMWI